jgi:hypothetical protein
MAAGPGSTASSLRNQHRIDRAIGQTPPRRRFINSILILFAKITTVAAADGRGLRADVVISGGDGRAL